jgi:hypothetical protein
LTNLLFKNISFAPKMLFVIDGVGAMLSAVLISVVLVRFESIFGIPASTLYVLAAIPVGFAIYDMLCYQLDLPNQVKYLKGIGILNLLYCSLSIGLSLYHKNTITYFGWAYIIGEVLIVGALAWVELSSAYALSSRKIFEP